MSHSNGETDPGKEKEQMENKRKVLLADQFINVKLNVNNAFIDHRVHKSIQANTMYARKFVFDETASAKVAEVVKEIPELLLQQSEFARPPFDLTWIEYNHRAFWKTMQPNVEPAENADNRVGYLINHNTVLVVVNSADYKPGVLTPYQYHLNTEWPIADQIRIADSMQLSRMQLDIVLWGITYDSLDTDDRRYLRDHNSMTILPLLPKHLDSVKKAMQDYARGSSGELRNIIAFLLMLNRPAITQFEQVPSGRGWMRNRFVPYAAYNNVTVSLSAPTILRLMGTVNEQAITKRRHEVRGHFCQNEESRKAHCVHSWEVDYHDGDAHDFPTHWECKYCHGKRWWRIAHERGDASKGFVTKQYTVTE